LGRRLHSKPWPKLQFDEANVVGVEIGRSVASGCASAFSFQRRRYHVAVIGSGPSAFYTTKYLFKQVEADRKLKVDMYERLPVPFGLVRFGVAPDHPEVKNVRNDFAIVANTPGFRFLGNIEVGKDISVADLRKSYDAVVVCTGAEGERMLGIPGENSDNVLGAPAFVKWYNGHPDFVSLQPKGPGESAVVLGQGNVALDVARVLCCSAEKMRQTDIHGPALDKIAGWQKHGLRMVHVVGRRGFVQAAFTNAELRELLSFDEEVLPVVDPAELALCRNPASEQELSKNRAKKRSVNILEEMAKNFAHKDTTSKRVLWLRFLWSPSSVLAADTGVVGLQLDRTELVGEPGKQSAAKAASGESLEVPCGLVVRSVGFDIVPFDGLPLENRRVPHANGRVDAPSPAAGGLYVSGWLKRGPQGIIASNIPDAQETAACILRDLQEGHQPRLPGSCDDVLTATGKRIVSFDDWRRIEAEEYRLGEAAGRLAVKFTEVPKMLKLLDH
jgi:NADPH-dependent glutamate synthase beta subunit-like oxidoreductase